MPFQQPALTYPFAALEPHIDAATMELHYSKHHAAYVSKLNAALEKHPELFQREPEDLLREFLKLPAEVRTAVRNHGGGHVNHTMFWQIMMPKGGGQPSGRIAEAITQTFGGFDAFRRQFIDAGAAHFGSGWVWLVHTSDRKLKILTTANQDSPLLEGLEPVMGNDLWEHAYYLKYQNRRPEYLEAWWNVLNWAEIGKRLERIQSRKTTVAA